MLPGISCQDQMFVDLGVDPGACGCQIYEATSFLIHHTLFDPTAGLVLLQAAILGEASWPPSEDNRRLHVLIEYLVSHYGRDHEVCVYEASFNPDRQARIQRAPLSRLGELHISVSSTLYVPPKALPALNFEMIERLGMKPLSQPDDPGAWARQSAEN